MIRVVFTDIEGVEQAVDAEPGETLMACAKRYDVSGIEAECGGSMVCGTCHVYVDDEWSGRVGGPGDMEAEMLEYVIEPKPTSRLSCQIAMTSALDGLSVRTPVSQR